MCVGVCVYVCVCVFVCVCVVDCVWCDLATLAMLRPGPNLGCCTVIKGAEVLSFGLKWKQC